MKIAQGLVGSDEAMGDHADAALVARPALYERLDRRLCLNLEIPKQVILADGTTAQVKAVAVTVIEGRLGEVVYTVEKQSGAWAEVTARDLRPQGSP